MKQQWYQILSIQKKYSLPSFLLSIPSNPMSYEVFDSETSSVMQAKLLPEIEAL